MAVWCGASLRSCGADLVLSAAGVRTTQQLQRVQPQLDSADVRAQRADAASGRRHAARHSVLAPRAGNALQVQFPLARHQQQGVPVQRSGQGQHVLESRQRRYDLDVVRDFYAVGVRKGLGTVRHLEQQSDSVRRSGDHLAVLARPALLHSAPDFALETDLQLFPLPASPQYQCGSVVGPLHAPDRASALFHALDHFIRRSVPPDPHVLPYAAAGTQPGAGAHRLRPSGAEAG